MYVGSHAAADVAVNAARKAKSILTLKNKDVKFIRIALRNRTIKPLTQNIKPENHLFLAYIHIYNSKLFEQLFVKLSAYWFLVRY